MKKKITVGLIIGIALMWFLFRETDFQEVWKSVREASVLGLGLSVVLVLVTFVTRVQRWTYIVRTAQPVSFRQLFSATQIGFLANFVLPFRLGEAVRALVLTRLTRIPFSKSLAMVAMDRVTDLFGLLAVVVVTMLAYSPEGNVVLPKEVLNREFVFSARSIERLEYSVVIMVVAFVTTLVLLYVNQGLVLRCADACVGLASKKFAARVHQMLQHFTEGLHIFRSPSDMAKSLFFSLITWSLFVLTMMTAMHAFHIPCPWYTAFVMELLVALFLSPPGLPGLLGQFQFPIVVALMLLVPEIGISKAVAFSMMAYFLNLFPVVVVGVFCLSWEKFEFAELTRESSKAKSGATVPPDAE